MTNLMKSNTIHEIDYSNDFLLSNILFHILEIGFWVFPVKKNAMISSKNWSGDCKCIIFLTGFSLFPGDYEYASQRFG